MYSRAVPADRTDRVWRWRGTAQWARAGWVSRAPPWPGGLHALHCRTAPLTPPTNPTRSRMRHARARLCRRARVQATRVCCMVAKGVLRCNARARAPHAVSLAPQGCAHLRRTKSSPPTPLPRHFGPASACQARRGVAGGPRPPSRVEWLAASPFSRGRLRPARRLARRHLPASRTVWAGVDHVVVPNLVVQRARTISGSGGGAISDHESLLPMILG